MLKRNQWENSFIHDNVSGKMITQDNPIIIPLFCLSSQYILYIHARTIAYGTYPLVMNKP